MEEVRIIVLLVKNNLQFLSKFLNMVNVRGRIYERSVRRK